MTRVRPWLLTGALVAGSWSCSSESPTSKVCERVKEVANRRRDDTGAIVVDLEGIGVQELNEASRLSLVAAIEKVRAEFDNATGEVNGWSTRSVTDWAEGHCSGEFATLVVTP